MLCLVALAEASPQAEPLHHYFGAGFFGFKQNILVSVMQKTSKVSSWHREPELWSNWEKQCSEIEGRNKSPNVFGSLCGMAIQFSWSILALTQTCEQGTVARVLARVGGSRVNLAGFVWRSDCASHTLLRRCSRKDSKHPRVSEL